MLATLNLTVARFESNCLPRGDFPAQQRGEPKSCIDGDGDCGQVLVGGGGTDVGVARADEGFFLAEVDLDAPAPEGGLEEFFEAHVRIGAEEFGSLAQAVGERGDDEEVMKDGVFAGEDEVALVSER